LLQRLYSQKLIDKKEFERRRQGIIDTALGGAQEPTMAVPQKVAEKKDDLVDRFIAANPPGRYVALIIGNNNYRFVPKLATAVNDAEVVAKVLKERYGFEVVLLKDVKRYEVLRSLGKLRRELGSNDNLLVYYAGHGILDEAASRGYWLPVDAEPDFTANWISTAAITDFLKASDAKHILVVSDSCYSGTLLRAGLNNIRGGGDRLALLNRLAKKKSRTVITSGGLEPVADGGGDGHSVFARAFIDALSENKTAVEAQSLFSGVRNQVITKADQTPEYSDVRKAGHDGGDFIFLPKTPR
jgi:uncharacterized caspase-like protein